MPDDDELTWASAAQSQSQSRSRAHAHASGLGVNSASGGAQADASQTGTEAATAQLTLTALSLSDDASTDTGPYTDTDAEWHDAPPASASLSSRGHLGTRAPTALQPLPCEPDTGDTSATTVTGAVSGGSYASAAVHARADASSGAAALRRGCRSIKASGLRVPGRALPTSLPSLSSPTRATGKETETETDDTTKPDTSVAQTAAAAAAASTTAGPDDSDSWVSAMLPPVLTPSPRTRARRHGPKTGTGSGTLVSVDLHRWSRSEWSKLDSALVAEAEADGAFRTAAGAAQRAAAVRRLSARSVVDRFLAVYGVDRRDLPPDTPAVQAQDAGTRTHGARMATSKGTLGASGAWTPCALKARAMSLRIALADLVELDAVQPGSVQHDLRVHRRLVKTGQAQAQTHCEGGRRRAARSSEHARVRALAPEPWSARAQTSPSAAACEAPPGTEAIAAAAEQVHDTAAGAGAMVSGSPARKREVAAPPAQAVASVPSAAPPPTVGSSADDLWPTRRNTTRAAPPCAAARTAAPRPPRRPTFIYPLTPEPR